MNYKIRHNKNRPAMRPARYSLAWPWALVNRGRLMNIATFSSWDLWECYKSYVASYWANKELVNPQMFSCKLCQWRWFAKVFFRERFPIYITSLCFKDILTNAVTMNSYFSCVSTYNDNGTVNQQSFMIPSQNEVSKV